MLAPANGKGNLYFQTAVTLIDVWNAVAGSGMGGTGSFTKRPEKTCFYDMGPLMKAADPPSLNMDHSVLRLLMLQPNTWLDAPEQ